MVKTLVHKYRVCLKPKYSDINTFCMKKNCDIIKLHVISIRITQRSKCTVRFVVNIKHFDSKRKD